MLAFVYGTLTDPDRAAAVLDDHAFEGPATLDGLVAVRGRYPTVAPPAEGGADATVEGRLLRTPDVAAVDDYEGVDEGLYVRASVPVAGRDDAAAVYVGDPVRLGVEAPVGWPGTGQFAERVERYLAASDVRVRPADS